MNVKIHNNKNIKGKVNISGSKNASLPIICGSILNKNKVTLYNIPHITDVDNILDVLKYLNCKIHFKNNVLKINSSKLIYKPLTLENCKKIRASYYFIGVFLTLFNKCEILLPGGCNIGNRPIDFHIDAFQKMGYICKIEDDVLTIINNKNKHNFDVKIINKSVGTTMNVLLGGLGFNQGIIRNVLIEPECEDLIKFLTTLGFLIKIDDNSIIINNKNKLKKNIKYRIIPDRIETMTYTVIGLMCGKIKINKCNPNHLLIPLSILKESCYKIKIRKNSLHVYKSVGNHINIKTNIYPGFPTDLQPIFGVLASQTKQVSTIEETIFEDRLQIYEDLINSGVNCDIDNKKVIIVPSKIKSANYKVKDLRQGAALIILALIGDNSSIISNFELVLRGYENIIKKLRKLRISIKEL